MKAILEFSLPEDQDDLNTAISASKVHAAVSTFLEHLRQKIKYENLTEDEDRIYEEIRAKMYECLEEYEITLV